jgi:hypothetical protein
MVFEDKELEISIRISNGNLIDSILELDDSEILEFVIKMDEQLSDHKFTMDLIISLIKNMSDEFKNGDLIKIRSALTDSKLKEGKQFSL